MGQVLFLLVCVSEVETRWLECECTVAKKRKEQ